MEREFEALKERVAGKRTGILRGSCINATLPLSQLSSRADDLCAACQVGYSSLKSKIHFPVQFRGMINPLICTV